MTTLTLTIPADMLESLIHAVGLEVSYTYTQARATTSQAELPPIHTRRNRLWALQDELQAMREDDPLTPAEVAEEHRKQAEIDALADKDNDITGYYTHADK